MATFAAARTVVPGGTGREGLGHGVGEPLVRDWLPVVSDSSPARCVRCGAGRCGSLLGEQRPRGPLQRARRLLVGGCPRAAGSPRGALDSWCRSDRRDGVSNSRAARSARRRERALARRSQAADGAGCVAAGRRRSALYRPPDRRGLGGGGASVGAQGAPAVRLAAAQAAGQRSSADGGPRIPPCGRR
jgi:hypothetical protein